MKKFFFAILIALCCTSLLTTHAKAAEDLNEITPYADIKEWKFKTIDGQMHKRLFNVSKNKWEGSWIKV